MLLCSRLNQPVSIQAEDPQRCRSLVEADWQIQAKPPLDLLQSNICLSFIMSRPHCVMPLFQTQQPSVGFIHSTLHQSLYENTPGQQHPICESWQTLPHPISKASGLPGTALSMTTSVLPMPAAYRSTVTELCPDHLRWLCPLTSCRKHLVHQLLKATQTNMGFSLTTTPFSSTYNHASPFWFASAVKFIYMGGHQSLYWDKIVQQQTPFGALPPLPNVISG